MSARESRACALALLAFAVAATTLLLLLSWRSSYPLPLLEHAPSHVEDAGHYEADARTFAHFIYDVYLRQCLEFRRPRNASSSTEFEVCALGTPSNATHCVHSQAQQATADLEQRRVLQQQQRRALSAALKGRRVEWAADDESGSQRDAVERRGERDERRSAQPLAPASHPSSLIGHIFLGALLLLSVGVALCEVFRDRLREKLANAASTQQAAAGGALEDSQAEQPAQSALRRHRLITAMSFDSGLGMSVAVQPPRPSYRILGHRPPPLQRRSSFPVPLASGPSGGDQSGSKLSRRSSVEQSEEESSPDLRRRVRIIRRH